MYRRLLLASVSLFAVCASAQGAQLTWTAGGADQLWSNTANWDTGAAPTAADSVHLNGQAPLWTDRTIELTAGTTTITSLFVETDIYTLEGDAGVGHELVVTNTLSLDQGTELIVSEDIGMVARGAIDLAAIGNGILLTGTSHLTLDGADLDSGVVTLTDGAWIETAQTGASAGSITGGKQVFSDTSTLWAQHANGVAGGEQWFHNQSALHATVANAVNGGTQSFYQNARLNALATNSVSGGIQRFSDTSQLFAGATGSVGDTTIQLEKNAFISTLVVNALSDTTDIQFYGGYGGTGGSFFLNGYDQVVGTITSGDAGGTGALTGVISNDGPQNAELTVRSGSDSVFGGVLEDGSVGGTLGLIKDGTGRLFLLGNSTYTGQTEIFNGELAVHGDISSSSLLFVDSNGTLSGTGTVGATNVGGGTLRPGYWNSTLRVDGNLAMDGSSVYAVDIRGAGDGSAGGSSSVAVTGNLDLLSTPDIQIWNYGYAYTAGTKYTIATANSVISTFDANLIDGDISPFLKFVLEQDATSVSLRVVRSATLASAAETPNQEAVAEAVDGLTDGNPVFDMIASLGEDDALAALDAFSGEVHASLKGGLIEDSRFVREASLGRLEDAEGNGLWTEAYGARGVWGSDGNAAEATRDARGLLVGTDGTAGDFRFGALLGYGQSGYGVVDRGSSATVDSYQAALYGGTVNGPFLLRGGLAYARNDITTRRDVAIADVDFAATYDANYAGATTQAFGEVGYRLEMGSASVTPFGGLAYINSSTDGFTEAGGVGALTAEAQSAEQTYAALGLRAETAFELGEMSARLHGSLAWRRWSRRGSTSISPKALRLEPATPA